MKKLSVKVPKKLPVKVIKEFARVSNVATSCLQIRIFREVLQLEKKTKKIKQLMKLLDESYFLLKCQEKMEDKEQYKKAMPRAIKELNARMVKLQKAMNRT